MSVLNNKQFITVLVIGAAGLYVLSRKAGDVVTAINPMNHDNVFNQAAIGFGEAVTGNPQATQGFFDHLYGGADLLNPFAPDYRKQYAKKVWGLE